LSQTSHDGKEPVVLWLVRHGQTDWNKEGRYQGQADPPLNQAGLAEARQAAHALAGLPLDAIITSDLQRAARTAAIISHHTGLPVRVDERLREVDLGDWEGILFPEIQERYPAEIEARKREPLDFRAPGGETLREVARRVWQAADEIAIKYPGKQVVVVSHGLALASLLARARGEDLGAAYGLIPPNAIPQRIVWRAGIHNVHQNTLPVKVDRDSS
jgi:broad specificity phosphatase PhoE